MADEKDQISVIETAETITPEAIQARFTTLAPLDGEQMAALHKRLVRRIDWRMMPTITIMFLMKYVLSRRRISRGLMR